MYNNANRIKNPMKVITGPDTRWSYANVWEPKSINGGTPKYSVSLIIPKSDTNTVALPQNQTVIALVIIRTTPLTNGSCLKNTTFVMLKPKWLFRLDLQNILYRTLCGRNITSTKR